MPFKEDVVEWAISASRHGCKWWMPVLLTGATMFTIVGMSNGKVGVVLAPLCLTAGASIAAITYIQIMKTSGADALLERTGAKDSKFLATAQEWAKDWGALGLIFIQVNPLTPIPTAVLVVAGMLAKMDEVTVFSVLMAGKFLMLLLNSVAVYYVSEGQTVEECLRKHLKPLGEEQAEDKKDD